MPCTPPYRIVVRRRLLADRRRWLAIALALAVPASGMLLASWLGGADGSRAAALRAGTVVLLYAAGTVHYARTTTDGEERRTDRMVSAGFHGAAYVDAAVLEPCLVIPFGLCLARAVLLPPRAPGHPGGGRRVTGGGRRVTGDG